MTPERRKELRRCDEACFRTRTARQIEEKDKRIKELESTVATDNTETLVNALERIKALESLLARAGDFLYMNSVEYGVDELCIEIDAILPKTEEVK